MTYCQHCGRELDDGAKFCPGCGTPRSVPNASAETVAANDGKYQTRQTLRLIAFILVIISCVGAGWTLIPLAWLIPMAVTLYRAYQDPKQELSVGFKVCFLLFANAIGGILLLVEDC